MLSSLSDRTKMFIVYSAVFLVAVCNIMFELNWTTATGPVTLATVPTFIAPFAPRQAAPFLDSVPADDAPAPAAVPARPAAPQVSNLCDQNACTEAYRSFRASDCTYQPNEGPRRLCTRGRPPQ